MLSRAGSENPVPFILPLCLLCPAYAEIFPIKSPVSGTEKVLSEICIREPFTLIPSSSILALVLWRLLDSPLLSISTKISTYPSSGMMDLLFDKLDECFGLNIPSAVDKLLGTPNLVDSEARANTKKNQESHQRPPPGPRSHTRQSSNRDRSNSESSRHLHRDSDQLERAIARHRIRERPPKCVGFRLPGEPQPGDSEYPPVVERVPLQDWDPTTGKSRWATRSRSRDRNLKPSDDSKTRHRYAAHGHHSHHRDKESTDERDANRGFSRHQPKTRRRAYSSPPPPMYQNRYNMYESDSSGRGQSGDGARNIVRELGDDLDADKRYLTRARRRANSSPPPPTELNRHKVYEFLPCCHGQSGAGSRNGSRELGDECPRDRPRTRRRANSSPPPSIHRDRHNVYESTPPRRGPSQIGAKDYDYTPRYIPPSYYSSASAWSDEYSPMRGRVSSESKPRYILDYADDVEHGKKEIHSLSGGHSGRDGKIAQRHRRSATL